MNFVFEWWHYPVLFGIGLLVSFINAIAGGGSVLSLPLLIFLGLPSAMANGTNRLGILAGSLSATYSMSRAGLVPTLSLRRLAIPVGLGALLGAWGAVAIPDRAFNMLLAVVVLTVVAATFFGMSFTPQSESEAAELKASPMSMLSYFLLGLYGGFLQVGSGFLMIFLFRFFSSMNLLRINGLKVACTVLFTAVSILVFTGFEKIHWPMAFALALGNVLGGFWGVRWQIQKGEIWIRRFLVFMGVVVSVKLVWDTFV